MTGSCSWKFVVCKICMHQTGLISDALESIQTFLHTRLSFSFKLFSEERQMKYEVLRKEI